MGDTVTAHLNHVIVIDKMVDKEGQCFLYSMFLVVISLISHRSNCCFLSSSCFLKTEKIPITETIGFLGKLETMNYAQK
jgi:hypothetical protein